MNVVYLKLLWVVQLETYRLQYHSVCSLCLAFAIDACLISNVTPLKQRYNLRGAKGGSCPGVSFSPPGNKYF